LFYCFSSSTEFDPERGYNRFSVYAILEHGGDFTAASKALAARGYGTQTARTQTTETRTNAPAADPLAILTAADVLKEPDPIEIVEGLAWASWITAVVSETGAGKSFVLLDLAAHVSAGYDWHGRATLSGSIVYFAYERDALKLRLLALQQAGLTLDHLFVIRGRDPLSPRVTREAGELPARGELDALDALARLEARLARDGHPPLRLIVIDTIRASLSGSEDSSEAVSAYLRAVVRLMAAYPGAACLLAHHSGWQDGESAKKRERGSSAWRGNSDATVYLEAGPYDETRGEAPLTLTTYKSRDLDRARPLHLIRRRVELPLLNRHREPYTSCVIETDRRSREDRDAERAAADATTHRATDRAVLQAIRDYPAATSIRLLRAHLNVASSAVEAAVARLLRDGCLLPGRRGQPYQLTPQGHEAAKEPL
jgi:hypothetical protein